jgi:hypothetical protein
LFLKYDFFLCSRLLVPLDFLGSLLGFVLRPQSRLVPCNFRRRVKARVFPWFAPLLISVLAHACSPLRCPTLRFVSRRAPGLPGLRRFSCAQCSPLTSPVPHLIRSSAQRFGFAIPDLCCRAAAGSWSSRLFVLRSSLVRARRPDFGASDFRFRVLAIRRQASPFSARFRCALRKAAAKDFFISAQSALFVAGLQLPLLVPS